mgnify:CR=1 FL=1
MISGPQSAGRGGAAAVGGMLLGAGEAKAGRRCGIGASLLLSRLVMLRLLPAAVGGEDRLSGGATVRKPLVGSGVFAGVRIGGMALPGVLLAKPVSGRALLPVRLLLLRLSVDIDPPLEISSGVLLASNGLVGVGLRAASRVLLGTGLLPAICSGVPLSGLVFRLSSGMTGLERMGGRGLPGSGARCGLRSLRAYWPPMTSISGGWW